MDEKGCIAWAKLATELLSALGVCSRCPTSGTHFDQEKFVEHLYVNQLSYSRCP